MKSYSIEIELIDRTGKNVDSDVNCVINSRNISRNSSGVFSFKEEFEGSNESNIYNISFGANELKLNLFLDIFEEKINQKKTKLLLISNGKEISIDKESIKNNIAWNIDAKRQIVLIKVIDDKIDSRIGVESDNQIEHSGKNVKEKEHKNDTNDAEKINKIIEKAQKQGGMTYGELAVELGDASTA